MSYPGLNYNKSFKEQVLKFGNEIWQNYNVSYQKTVEERY